MVGVYHVVVHAKVIKRLSRHAAERHVCKVGTVVQHLNWREVGNVSSRSKHPFILGSALPFFVQNHPPACANRYELTQQQSQGAILVSAHLIHGSANVFTRENGHVLCAILFAKDFPVGRLHFVCLCDHDRQEDIHLRNFLELFAECAIDDRRSNRSHHSIQTDRTDRFRHNPRRVAPSKAAYRALLFSPIK